MSERVVVVGGVSRSLVNFRGPLLTCLRERGHEVLAAAPEDDDTPAVRQELSDMGVPLHVVPMARGGTNPIADFATKRALQALIRAEKPTAMIAYTAKPVIYGGMAAGAEGISFYPMITGLGYAFTEGIGLRRRLLQRVVRGLYGRGLSAANAVIFQNPDDQALFHDLGLVPQRAHSVRIDGSGVDREAFPPVDLPEEPTFLMLARLVADKGVREYLHAARQVKAKCPEARFLLAGGLDPNPSGITERELEEWQAEGTIEYLGKVQPVQPLLAQCRFYVLPSFYREGTPRSVLEAMATGRPIITTDAPGCRETVEHGSNGLLVQPRDADALAEAMLEILRKPAVEVERMASESLRLVQDRFDVRRVNESILAATGL